MRQRLQGPASCRMNYLKGARRIGGGRLRGRPRPHLVGVRQQGGKVKAGANWQSLFTLASRTTSPPARPAWPVPAVPAPGRPPPRTHGPAGQAQGSRTRAREQAQAQVQGSGVGAGQQQSDPSIAKDIDLLLPYPMAATRRCPRTSVGQSPALAHGCTSKHHPILDAAAPLRPRPCPQPGPPPSRRLPLHGPPCKHTRGRAPKPNPETGPIPPPPGYGPSGIALNLRELGRFASK